MNGLIITSRARLHKGSFLKRRILVVEGVDKRSAPSVRFEQRTWRARRGRQARPSSRMLQKLDEYIVKRVRARGNPESAEHEE